MSFLQGLGDVYANMKTQILLMEPLPSINRVFSLVQQQKRQLNGGGDLIEPKPLINHANNSRYGNHQNYGNTAWRAQGRGRSKHYGTQCSFCHKMNHSADECYSKNGFPPWMKQKHRTNVNYIEAQQISSKNQDSEQTDNVENKSMTQSQSLTSEQVQRLLKILHNSEDKNVQINIVGDIKPVESEKGNYNSFWILDIGATDHVTC